MKRFLLIWLLLVGLVEAGYYPRPTAGGGGGAASWLELTGKPVWVVTDAAYGAIPGDGLDDSAAINAAIADCKAAGGGTVFFPRGRYTCSGALDATTNSVITVPQTLLYYGQPVRINLIGEARGHITNASAAEDGGTILDFTGAPAGSGVEPAAIAGAASATAALADFNAVDLFLDGMNVMLGSNPTLNGINLRNCERGSTGDTLGVFAINSDGTISEPTHNTRGIIFPRRNNNVICKIEGTQVGGFAIGMEPGEHTIFIGPYIASCGIGLLIQEGNKRVWGAVTIEYVKTLVKLPATVAAPPKLNLSVDGETANTGDWRGYEAALEDINSVGTGRIDFANTLADSNTLVAPIVLGALNIEVPDLNATKRDLGNYTATQAARWKLADTSDSTGSNTLTNHGAVTFTAGGKVGSKANFNGSNQWLSSTLNLSGADFTISGWVKLTAGANQQLFTQWEEYPNCRWQVVYIEASKVILFDVMQSDLATDTSVASDPITDTDSHFIVAEYYHAQRLIRMKVNDGPWITATMALPMNTAGSVPPLTLGAGLESSGNTISAPLNGWLDSVRAHTGLINDKRATEFWAGGRGTEQ